jgi:hypothetical protein
MVVVHYSYQSSLIVIPAYIETRHKSANLFMLLDTGCSNTFVNHTLDCHKLPDTFEIDGLIGMDILSMFKFTVDPFKKTISVN